MSTNVYICPVYARALVFVCFMVHVNIWVLGISKQYVCSTTIFYIIISLDQLDCYKCFFIYSYVCLFIYLFCHFYNAIVRYISIYVVMKHSSCCYICLSVCCCYCCYCILFFLLYVQNIFNSLNFISIQIVSIEYNLLLLICINYFFIIIIFFILL